MRDDRPFGGADPPAAVFYYSRDRRGEHPAAHLRRLERHSAGRCLWRLWRSLCDGSSAGACSGSQLLGSQPAQSVRAGRY
ncbi:hypothetical protein [Mesorhizobium sp. AA23]|uniref:hypothetical protein n=1 Tax=Mesorhizobium sp. AA23 TaxID=1854058 RepID=UPI0032AF7E5D